MRLETRIRHLPARLVSGAFLVNSGVGKLGADEQTAEGLHGMARGAFPFVQTLNPSTFVKALAAGEITLGAALLLPVIPPAVAGAGLTSFAAGLLGLYARTPGMRRERSIRPTTEGTPLAKDAWLFGIGLSMVVDDYVTHRRVKRR